MKILKSITFLFCKLIVYLISYFNHRLYMKLYLPLLRFKGIKLNGIPRYIGKDVKFDNVSLIELGNRVVISNNCFFLTHDYSITTALISIGEMPVTDVALDRAIKVGDNVFIGKKSIIMPNSKIGNNVIIGAGSVVRGIIPDDSIVIGNPCVIIGSTSEQALKWRNYLKSDSVRFD